MIGEIKVLDDGFVRLLDVFGSDQTIEESARVSYGEGTRKVSDTRNLLRYLMNHSHTSPFEQAEVRFHLRLPIFVARQLIRHRTANVNEISGRYSKLDAKGYLPEELYAQSTMNKQGSGEVIDDRDYEIIDTIRLAQRHDQGLYGDLIRSNVSREQARIVLPVATYTEMIWKCDLHNTFHFLKLRCDSHAQQEIRVYAKAMLKLIEPHFPISVEAWKDYKKEAVTLSRMAMEVVRFCLIDDYYLQNKINFKKLCEQQGMAVREMNDLWSILQ